MGQSVIKNPRRIVSLPGGGGSGTIDGSGTANEIPYWVDSNTLGTLAVATYPNLTELSYVKGVTSAIQTQLNNLSVREITLDHLALNLADSTTYYFASRAGTLPPSTELQPISFPFNIQIVEAIVITSTSSTLATTETTAVAIGFDSGGGYAYTTLSSSVLFNARSTSYLATGLAINVTAGFPILGRIITPAWVTNPMGSNVKIILRYKLT